MKYIIRVFIVFFFILGCNDKLKNDNVIKSTTLKTPSLNKNKIEDEILNSSIDTLEIFKDSLNFGFKNKSKIKVIKLSKDENFYVKIQLYFKKSNIWFLNDSLTIPATNLPLLHAEIKDFNNDNFNDIVFNSGSAARGANNIQTLILFDSKNNKLKWIKNSENFPNLMYNEKLNCVDAHLFSGGLTTVFLKIDKDSLKEFATIEQRDGKIIIDLINKGEHRRIKTIIDKSSNDFKRYINFSPLEERIN